MWERAELDAEEELRQGDLLMDLLLPVPELPVALIRAGASPQAAFEQAVSKAKKRHFLVVSQCCTIANGPAVAIAPLSQTQMLEPEQRRSYEWETREQADDTSLRLAFSAMRVLPLDGILDDPEGGRIRIVNFEEVVSYKGRREELKAARVARMTPAGRRALRTRLMYFWGREAREDAEQLGGADGSAGRP